MSSSPAPEQADRVRDAFWYHTIELPGGIVTPGFFDTRAVAALVPLPGALRGARCLDVGTFDGFWAFEMERRGATEVVACDVLDPTRWDWPAGSADAVRDEIEARKRGNRGFEIAHDALESAVTLRDRSIYELDPAEDGEFDVVYVGSLLLHLRDPVGALERVRSVCRGVLVLEDAVDTSLGGRAYAELDGRGRPWWWSCSPRALARIAEVAGFRVTQGPDVFRLPYGAGYERPAIGARLMLTRAGRRAAVASRRGEQHAALLAEPAI